MRLCIEVDCPKSELPRYPTGLAKLARLKRLNALALNSRFSEAARRSPLRMLESI